ncbi:MAG: glucosamine-6-phosphate deaminase [Massiliimalia sp.]|jgi:glucosamine-6-phosphate deaminase
MNLIVANDYEQLSCVAAERIAQYINDNPNALLCFAAGDTPLGTFKKLIELQKQQKVNLSSVFYVGLDEWAGLEKDVPGTCFQVMHDNFYHPANIPSDRFVVFHGDCKNLEEECRRVQQWIDEHNGLDLVLLGVGMNGHVGFNEPGSPDFAGCFPIPLDNVTKEVSVKYFHQKLPLTYGLTIGWKTLKSAKKVLVLANGAKKAPVIKRAFCEPASADFTISLFQDHKDLTVILDQEASSEL